MEKIIAILEQIMAGQEFQTCEDFMESGLLDSMDVMDLVEKLEEEFDIEISGRDIVPENFKNAECIAQLMVKYVGEI